MRVGLKYFFIFFNFGFSILELNMSFAAAQGMAIPSVVCRSIIQSPIHSTIRSLAELRMKLDLALAKGAGSIVLTALRHDYQVKEQALAQHLAATGEMTAEELKDRIRQEIHRLQKQLNQNESEALQREEAEARRRNEHSEEMKKSVIDGYKAIFHRIEPGKFKMGEVGQQVDVTITKPFEMMATPVTQIIWQNIAVLVDLHFGSHFKIISDPSNFKGETRPVESVSFYEVQEWIRGLNELSKSGVPTLVELIPGHKMGDVYRLPTEAEWEFVVRGRGQYNETYHFGNLKSELIDYAWFSSNANEQTQPVATRKYLEIDGKKFYDFYGNVNEWIQDGYQDELPGGVDPVVLVSEKIGVARGGSWISLSNSLHSGSRNDYTRSLGYTFVGFRLVRNLQ